MTSNGRATPRPPWRGKAWPLLFLVCCVCAAVAGGIAAHVTSSSVAKQEKQDRRVIAAVHDQAERIRLQDAQIRVQAQRSCKADLQVYAYLSEVQTRLVQAEKLERSPERAKLDRQGAAQLQPILRAYTQVIAFCPDKPKRPKP